MSLIGLVHLPEPRLLFRYGQATEDPRDGLTLFGPLDDKCPLGVQAGVIGTKQGIELFTRWVATIQRPVIGRKLDLDRPPFPGFAAAYRIKWDPNPLVTIQLDAQEIYDKLYLDDGHQRVYGTVGVYADRILQVRREEEHRPTIWFVIIPDVVRTYCRPKSVLPPDLRLPAMRRFRSGTAQAFLGNPSLFPEMEQDATPYVYEQHFHNQLKARLLQEKVPTQIIRESILANIGPATASGLTASAELLQSEIAWSLTTGVFYKVGGRPWKVANVRKGVCYVGVAYKQDTRQSDMRMACCAAQLFLDSGDGIVFKGAVGPWYSPETKQFHLSMDAARELAGLAIRCYTDQAGDPPKEMFIHSTVRFNKAEWDGFRQAAGKDTIIVGVRIRDAGDLKLFRLGRNAVLRGMAYIIDDRQAFLWTRGWTPRLQTYTGREVPNPLEIEITRADADIRIVLQDILALTKLNYNTCIFSDGKPITLKFADAVGEILTARPTDTIPPPLPFAYYI